MDRLLVVGGGVDGVPARELVLKVEEGLHQPAAFRDLETLLHGHFPAMRRAHRPRARHRAPPRPRGALQRAVGPAARRAAPRHPHGGDRHAGGQRRAAGGDLTSAGRIELPREPSRAARRRWTSLLSTALALQHLTLGLVHAAGTNPDLIRREQDAYREAAALSRPEGG